MKSTWYEKKEIGENFERFIIKLLGLTKNPNKKGIDTLEGIEIKQDETSLFSGNLFIETGRNEHNLTSGIYAYQETRFYLMGTYDYYYCFPIRYLKELDKKTYTETVDGEVITIQTYRHTQISCDTRNAYGYILPLSKIPDKYKFLIKGV